LKQSTTIFLRRLSILPRYLNKSEKTVVLVFAAVIFASALMCIKERFFERVVVPQLPKTYVEGTVGEIRNLVPILSQNETEKDISRLIFSSLIKFNEKREIVGDLADHWEISEDGKTYTFFLKPAKWQDGSVVTADDVIFTFSLIRNEKLESPFYGAFSKVEVQKKDDKTVSFTTAKVCASFLSSLTIPILPQSQLSNYPRILDAPFVKKPVGSGPFHLEKIEQQKQFITVTLSQNKNYYGQIPKIDNFIINVYSTSEEAKAAYDNNEIDGLVFDKPLGDTNYKLKLPQSMALYFNLSESFLSKDLRKAFAYSINKDEIIAAVPGSEKIDFAILPGFLGYKDSTRYDFSPDEAKKYWQKAKNKPASLSLTISSDETNRKVAEILVKKWQEVLGINVEIKEESNGSLQDALNARDFDIALAGVNQKADSDPYPFWHSSQITNGLNFSGYKNKEADKLLEDGRQTLDANLRGQKYNKFLDIIQQDVPAIFLYQSTNYYAVKKEVQGVSDVLGVTRADRFWNVEKWTTR